MVIAVDFDGTIVEHAYPEIGKPIPFALDVLKKLQQEEHHFIILWTVREGSLLQKALDYCEKQGLTFYAVNKNYSEEVMDNNTPRKLDADLYIDDKNIGGIPDWGVIYRIVKSGSNNIHDFDDFMVNEKTSKKKNFFIRFGETLDMVKKSRY
jgi:trehalose-6-phosphatase